MNDTIEQLEQSLQQERERWQSLVKKIVAVQCESAVQAYYTRFQRIVELEQSLAVLQGNSWTKKQTNMFQTMLADEARDYILECRKEEMDYLKYSPIFKTITK